MAKIFISYARNDKAAVRKFVNALEHSGHDVFWDFDIPTGSSWNDFIREQLQSADVVLVVWSRNSIQSDFVKEEAARAKAANKLFPVKIDGAEIPFGFGQIQTTDMNGWSGSLNDEQWLTLAKSVDVASSRLHSLKENAGTSEGIGQMRPPEVTYGIGLSGLAALALCVMLVLFTLAIVWAQYN